jgi:phage terminase large subunit-like protein
MLSELVEKAAVELETFEFFCSKLTTQQKMQLLIEPFQRELLTPTFADVKVNVICLPKKNGKSTIIAAVALYHLLTVDLADVIVIASSKEQAAILYKHCCKFIATCPQLQEAFLVRSGSKEIRKRGDELTRIRVLANDPGTLEGIEPTLGIVDEYHEYVSSEAYSIIRDGIDTRNGQMLVITNAGEDEESPFGELRAGALQLAHNERRDAYRFCLNDSHTFAYSEYALDPDADVDDMALVKTANPASWITEDFLRERKKDPGQTPQRFKRMACGLWVRSEDTAILPEEWDSLAPPMRDAVPIPKGSSIWIGWDHATRGPDKAALVPLWWKSNDERVFGDPIILSAPEDGGMISDLDVTNALLEFEQDYQIEAIVYDPEAGAAMLATMLEREHGWLFAEHSQKSSTLSKADVRFLEAVREKKIIHNGNREFRQHVLNAVTRTVSTAGEWIFGRPKHGKRVPMDALRAASLAHAVALTENEFNSPGVKPVFF